MVRLFVSPYWSSLIKVSIRRMRVGSIVAQKKSRHPKATALLLRFEPDSGGQRVRSYLEGDFLAVLALAAFLVPHDGSAIGRLHRLALPAGLRIVDPEVQTARVEAHRVGYAEGHELAGARRQRDNRVRVDRREEVGVLAETHHVEIVRPL